MLSLVGALLILILMSSYQLFFSHTGSYEGTTLGRVSALEKVVKIKRARALDWVDAFPDDLVTENQMIYTDNLSRAEVNFLAGQKLIISENSLVKIRSRGSENELDVGKGSIRATLTGDNPIIVKMNGEDYELKSKSADVEINLHGNLGEIGVVTGSVELEKDGKTTALDTKTALIVDGEKYSTRTMAFVPELPARKKLFYTGSDLFEVTFTWSGETSGSILISSEPDLKDAVKESIEGNRFVKGLSPGHYYWKLTSDKGDSLTSEFRIIKEVPPEILRPKNGEELDVLVNPEGSNSLRFEWESEAASAFQLEVMEDKLLSLPGITSPHYQYRAHRDGEISWRVKIDDPDRPAALWTEFQKIKVKLHPFPVVPEKLHPDGIEYQTFSGEGEKVELSWASSFGTEVEVLTPDENLKATGTSFTVDARKAGLYQWRVRSVDKFSRTSDWTGWKKFTLVDLSKEKNSEGIQRIQLSRPDQEVTFGWEKGSGENVFELSQDKNFEKVIIKKDVKGTETRLIIPKTGTYYWRSREYREDGTLQVSEPKKVIIEPVPAPVKPEPLPALEVPIERTAPTTSFFELFSPAYADDVFGLARIHLPAQENTKIYLLRIFRKGETTPLVEEKLTGPLFLWKHALPGNYEYQYAIIDYFDRQSPFSDLSALTIKETPGPERPLLISPIRLEEVPSPAVAFKWKASEHAQKYKLSLFKDEELQEKIAEEEVKKTEHLFSGKLATGTYFWQVVAIDEHNLKTPSSIGRFVYHPAKEEVIAVPDFPGEWQKAWKSRAQVAWAPSSDSYGFDQNGSSGKIDGTTMLGLEGRGTIFSEKWIYSGEFLRQSGKVFKKEEYSFMKLTLDAGKKIKLGKGVFSIGAGLGFGSGQSYSILNSTVSASGVSGTMYGFVGRGFYAFNPVYSLEGKAAYLLGSIKEMDLSGNLLRNFKDFYLVLGLGIIKREYDKNNGEQSSLKLNAGIGREF